MGALPDHVESILNAALVSEFTVLDKQGSPVTYPMIPLYDGEFIYMTSSVLFWKKLDHIKKNPRVSLTISDRVGTPGVDPFHRVTIQGDASVIEDDLHSGWEKILPLWVAKEPIISDLVKKRFAMPLFWERSVIKIAPRRVLVWPNGNTSQAPEVIEPQRVS